MTTRARNDEPDETQEEAALVGDIAACDASDRSSPEAVLEVAPPEEALRLARLATVAIADYYPWLGPIVEAIRLNAVPEAEWATCWGGSPLGNEPIPDPDKHAAYVEHIKNTLSAGCPWLLALLESSGATVIVSPGVFKVMFLHRLGVPFEIPELAAITHLTPWLEPHETKH
jgi:hypothetical protein